MNLSDQLRQPNGKLRAFLCLLLFLSFLYNPYLSAQASTGALNLRHSFSHRATVGSSELDKYSPLTGHDTHTAVELSVVSPFVALALSPDYFFIPPYALAPRPLISISAGLWFRPPPAI
jgi:hypothetical protein